MKIFKKALSLIVALAITASFAACGGGKKDSTDNQQSSADSSSESGTKYDPSKRPAGKKIVIYCGGSSEYSVVKGSEE